MLGKRKEFFNVRWKNSIATHVDVGDEGEDVCGHD